MRIRSLVYSIVCGSALAALASLTTQPRLAPYAGVKNNGQVPEAPPSPAPDERFKADILVVVAHPDDETMVSAYLAKAVYDEHKRVAVIYGTRGDGGGNAMGYEHGAALGKAVRLVRLTRPEVVLTWLPDYVAGENHDDHQAAGVIATEAFDLAGDPTVFPEQVSAPRNRTSISNLTEGLRPWQPKKIYYFSDASHTDFLEGKGPEYRTTDVSPSRHLPYYRMAAEEMRFHLTQGDTGQLAKQALAAGNFEFFKQPVRLIFGKSLVKSATTGDVFEGVDPAALPYSPVRGYQPKQRDGLSLELGGPWAFYPEFW